MNPDHESTIEKQQLSLPFLAAHALQEPLRKINLFTTLIAEDSQSQLSDEALLYLERIVLSAKRMQHITESLTTYRQLRAHDENARQFEVVELRLTMEEVINGLADPIRLAAATVEMTQLPVVNGRPELLSLLFTNLISNALLYVKPGSTPCVAIRSSLVYQDGKEYHKIEVLDSGLGFAQEDAERIFEPFQRLLSRDKYEGSGMGLSICREIAQLHGGFISASGAPGKGATFSLLIPAKR